MTHNDSPHQEAPLSSAALAQLTAQLVSDNKGHAIVIIDVRQHVSYTDFVVVATGTSERHVHALTSNVVEQLKRDNKIQALATEGLREGAWALADFGDVVLHVMHEYTRGIYRLEELWPGAAIEHLRDE